MRTLSNLKLALKPLLFLFSLLLFPAIFCLVFVSNFENGEASTKTGTAINVGSAARFSGKKEKERKEVQYMLDQLTTNKDGELDAGELSQKYLGLLLASTAMSASATERWEQQYWSDLAISFGEIARQMKNSMETDDLNEINARLLVAMALNYYQGGEMDEAGLKAQYKLTSEQHLIGSGFCNYGVLLALQQDGIILLPGNPFLKNI